MMCITLQSLLREAFLLYGLNPNSEVDRSLFVERVRVEIGIEIPLSSVDDGLNGVWLDNVSLGDLAQALRKPDGTRWTIEELLRIRDQSHNICSPFLCLPHEDQLL